MNQIERFNYYVKNWKEKQIIKIPEEAKKFEQNELIYYSGPNTPAPKNFPFKHGCWEKNFWWSQGNFGIDIPCLSISADGINNHKLPAIVKVRYIDDPKGGLLGPLKYDRHWGQIKKINKKNILWSNKKNECVWRGVPTGIQDSGSKPGCWKNKRILFCHKWNNKFNVGIVNTFNRWDSNYIKPRLNIHDMLKYKFLISIPGNDKDSGLNWKLASNSVVLMAPPEIESWLMEGLLKPWIHYVPLAEDYSNLDKIMEWCTNNDNKCQEIVKNANNFMKQFDNIEVEKKIFNMIKEHYKNTFTLI